MMVKKKKRAAGLAILPQDDDTSYYKYITKIYFEVVVNRGITLFPSYNIKFYEEWEITNGSSSSMSGLLNMDLWRDD